MKSAEATKETKVTVHLDLTEEVASWLMGIMQNPLSNMEKKDSQDTQYREKIFFALGDSGIRPI